MHADPARPDRLLRLPEVVNRTGLAKSTIYREIAVGSFPKSVRVTEQCVAWRESSIDEFIASRPANETTAP